MFTGIVHHTGSIVKISENTDGKCFTIRTQFMDLIEGESISVDGVCLTVTHFSHEHFNCDVSPETLRVTRMQHLRVGDNVNLERSLRLADRLGGHFVSGHVDQVCQLCSQKTFTDFVKMIFAGIEPAAIKKYFIKKGSVAINGVSLTINEVYPDSFEVMLIPETLRKTNLITLKVGDTVNIEYDLLAKLVAQQLEAHALHNNALLNLEHA